MVRGFRHQEGTKNVDEIRRRVHTAYVFHYATSKFPDEKDPNVVPRISAVCVRSLVRGSTVVFSPLRASLSKRRGPKAGPGKTYFRRHEKELERAFLMDFFKFLSENKDCLFVGWRCEGNMFGLEALRTRCVELYHDEISIPELPRVIDLARTFEHLYGEGFAPKPRLTSLATANGFDASEVLQGVMEANLAGEYEYGQVERSVQAETSLMESLIHRQLDGQLKPCPINGRGFLAKFSPSLLIDRAEKCWAVRGLKLVRDVGMTIAFVGAIFFAIWNYGIGGAAKRWFEGATKPLESAEAKVVGSPSTPAGMGTVVGAPGPKTKTAH